MSSEFDKIRCQPSKGYLKILRNISYTVAFDPAIILSITMNDIFKFFSSFFIFQCKSYPLEIDKKKTNV